MNNEHPSSTGLCKNLSLSIIALNLLNYTNDLSLPFLPVLLPDAIGKSAEFSNWASIKFLPEITLAGPLWTYLIVSGPNTLPGGPRSVQRAQKLPRAPKKYPTVSRVPRSLLNVQSAQKCWVSRMLKSRESA